METLGFVYCILKPLSTPSFGPIHVQTQMQGQDPNLLGLDSDLRLELGFWYPSHPFERIYLVILFHLFIINPVTF